jgi:hypothetical protein
MKTPPKIMGESLRIINFCCVSNNVSIIISLVRPTRVILAYHTQDFLK